MSHDHHHSPARRDWLKRSGLSAGGTLASGTLANLLLPAVEARAADYKALVCVFLYGGNDGMNTVVPTDAARYAQYAAVRGAIALPKAKLTPLTGINYGLHPALSALGAAWAGNRLAPVLNVGPLQAPLTKAAYRAAVPNSPLIPDGLFSHSDQQILWETGTTDSLTRTGWGGRASQSMATTNPVISAGGNGRFGMSSTAIPIVVPGPGSTFAVTEFNRGTSASALARGSALRTLYAQGWSNDLGDVYSKMGLDSFAMSDRLGPTLKILPNGTGAYPAIDAAFASITVSGQITTALGRQLYQIAKLIAANTTVQGSRQVFFASQGGFDTHSNQANTADTTTGVHAGVLKQVGDALAAFDAAMVGLAMSNAVTLFTQSEFGRTFKPNAGNGTDHAWGSHQLMMGGAVGNAKKAFGTYPSLVLGGDDDVGVASWEQQGRWIPTSSVDQYAATLLSWFGATDAQLNTILPNLPNFGTARRLKLATV